MTFPVFQQLDPISRNGEWHANLVRVGTVQAESAELAIIYAKRLSVFRGARGLAAHPIVG